MNSTFPQSFVVSSPKYFDLDTWEFGSTHNIHYLEVHADEYALLSVMGHIGNYVGRHRLQLMVTIEDIDILTAE